MMWASFLPLQETIDYRRCYCSNRLVDIGQNFLFALFSDFFTPDKML